MHKWKGLQGSLLPFLLTCKVQHFGHRRQPQPTDGRPRCSEPQLPLGARPFPGEPLLESGSGGSEDQSCSAEGERAESGIPFSCGPKQPQVLLLWRWAQFSPVPGPFCATGSLLWARMKLPQPSLPPLLLSSKHLLDTFSRATRLWVMAAHLYVALLVREEGAF